MLQASQQQAARPRPLLASPRARVPVPPVTAFAERERRYSKQRMPLWMKTQRNGEFRTKALRATIQWTDRAVLFGSQQYERKLMGLVKQLPADPTERREAAAAVDSLFKLLQSVPGLKVTRVHKAGSFGRRTNVTGGFDVDLLAYVSEFDGRPLHYPDDWLDKELQLTLRRRVKQWLENKGYGALEIANDAHYRNVLQITAGGGLELDLLFGPELVPASSSDRVMKQHRELFGPVYADPGNAVYCQMRERADTPALTEATRKLPEAVMDVVQLTKAWVRNLEATGRIRSPDGTRISSIALEVLVMAAYQRSQLRGPMRQELFAETLQLIVAAVEDGEVVMVDAGEWGYRRMVGMRCAAKNWAKHSIRIIHPTDPTCNITRPRGDRPDPNYTSLAREAKQLLGVLIGDSFDKLLLSSTLGAVAVPFMKKWNLAY